jgi:hypothetical protein
MPDRADKQYKIYEYARNGLDQYVPPHYIDFDRDISIRLHPVNTFSLGELVETIYYANAVLSPTTGQPTYSEPVVRETWVYVRDPSSHMAVYRTGLIEWYDEDGIIGPYPKNRGMKVYDTISAKREEFNRKRRNQTSRASEVCIGVLMASGMTMTQAVVAGQSYWQTLVSEIALYENGDPQPLRDRLGNDVDPAWVQVVKDYVLAELA